MYVDDYTFLSVDSSPFTDDLVKLEKRYQIFSSFSTKKIRRIRNIRMSEPK